ncbi:hypothetical protein ALC53_06923 [Atta colombica]|uniref:Uncharacterized protein n=1 Tax=Atta colombica TaxID=520822 RepID=A0A195BDZ3_9HYME|nr:hypothetical protein ALC53_06923 [Atta colombica]
MSSLDDSHVDMAPPPPPPPPPVRRTTHRERRIPNIRSRTRLSSENDREWKATQANRKHACAADCANDSRRIRSSTRRIDYPEVHGGGRMHRPPHPHPITDHRQVNLVFDDTVNIFFFYLLKKIVL